MIEIFQAIPILRIFDEIKAHEFYIDFLGFKIDWDHRNAEDTPLYMQISRSGMKLHLTEHHGDTTPGTTVFVAATGLINFHAEISAKNYTFNRPGVDPAPWGGLIMETTDPFGNRLRFTEETSE